MSRLVGSSARLAVAWDAVAFDPVTARGQLGTTRGRLGRAHGHVGPTHGHLCHGAQPPVRSHLCATSSIRLVLVVADRPIPWLRRWRRDLVGEGNDGDRFDEGVGRGFDGEAKAPSVGRKLGR